MIQTTLASQSQASKAYIAYGFDLSKLTFDASWRLLGLPPIQAPELRKMKTQVFARTRQGVGQWWDEACRRLTPGQKVMVVMEVTGNYSLEMVTWLRAVCPDVEVCIIPGKRVRDWVRGLGIDEKTDPIDARGLACYGAERQPPSYVALDDVHQKLRALSRTRQAIVEERVAIEQRLQEAASEHLDTKTAKQIQQALSKVVREMTKQIDRLEEQMEQLIAKDPQLAKDTELVDTLSGVGWVTAVTVFSETGDLRDYQHRSQLIAKVGLNPVICKSGTSVEKRTRISKKGSGRARRALYLAVLATISKDNPFAAMYHALVERGKKKMVAIVAVMRKMLLVMRAVVISGKPFDKDRMQSDSRP